MKIAKVMLKQGCEAIVNGSPTLTLADNRVKDLRFEGGFIQYSDKRGSHALVAANARDIVFSESAPSKK